MNQIRYILAFILFLSIALFSNSKQYDKNAESQKAKILENIIETQNQSSEAKISTKFNSESMIYIELSN